MQRRHPVSVFESNAVCGDDSDDHVVRNISIDHAEDARMILSDKSQLHIMMFSQTCTP